MAFESEEETRAWLARGRAVPQILEKLNSSEVSVPDTGNMNAVDALLQQARDNKLPEPREALAAAVSNYAFSKASIGHEVLSGQQLYEVIAQTPELAATTAVSKYRPAKDGVDGSPPGRS
jgi:hypothetical protein